VAAETPLTGGRATANVVRVGDEVRRPVGPHSEFVHAVLLAFEEAGFGGAPRFLGLDDQGRERLSYLDGWVAPDLAHDEWTDEQLVAAAELTRGFHDVLAGSPLAGGEETVCHNDLGPCNTVQEGGIPVAFIDWDSAGPGSRAVDLGHTAWYWAVISETDVLPLDEQVRRVRLMCDAYGDAVDRRSVPDAILAAQQRTIHNIAATSRRADADAPYWRRALEWHRGERDWFATHRQAFERGLR
jgi:aminoglycoside phosphotransferase (APT) family kinase protein